MGALFFASVEWFESKQTEMEQITQANRESIRQLQNINNINRWLRETVIPYFSILPLNQKNAELDMIRFYDQYASRYNFRVSQFIYHDSSTKMDIGFSFIPKNQNEIDHFLALNYPNGFLQIKTFSSKEGSISGVLTIIQPMQGDSNASGY
jgi:hypothetical protein